MKRVYIPALMLAVISSGASAETLDDLLAKGPVVVVEHDAHHRFSAAMGIVSVDVPIDKVWATVTDFQSYTQFVPKVVRSDAEKVSPTEVRVSWEIEVPGPNTKYTVLYHLDPANYRVSAEQVAGDLSGSRWSWWLEPRGPSRTLIHYTSSAKHFSRFLESVDDEQQTITIGVNVGGTLALLRAIEKRLGVS